MMLNELGAKKDSSIGMQALVAMLKLVKVLNPEPSDKKRKMAFNQLVANKNASNELNKGNRHYSFLGEIAEGTELTVNSQIRQKSQKPE